MVTSLERYLRGYFRSAIGASAIALVVLIAPSSNAQTSFTETGTFGTTSTKFGYNTSGQDAADSFLAANGTTTVSVAQYNPASFPGMTLQSVSVSWTATVSQSWTIENAGASATTYFASINDTALLFEPPTGTVTAENTNILAQSAISTTLNSAASPGTIGPGVPNEVTGSNSNLTASTGTVTIPGANIFSGNPSYPFDTAPANWTTADLLQYTGSGNVVFDVTGFANGVVTSGNGNVVASVNSTVAGTVLVTFTYVPEPSTWAFMGIGVVCAGLFLHKRRISARGYTLLPE